LSSRTFCAPKVLEQRQRVLVLRDGVIGNPSLQDLAKVTPLCSALRSPNPEDHPPHVLPFGELTHERMPGRRREFKPNISAMHIGLHVEITFPLSGKALLTAFASGFIGFAFRRSVTVPVRELSEDRLRNADELLSLRSQDAQYVSS